MGQIVLFKIIYKNSIKVVIETLLEIFLYYSYLKRNRKSKKRKAKEIQLKETKNNYKKTKKITKNIINKEDLLLQTKNISTLINFLVNKHNLDKYLVVT